MKYSNTALKELTSRYRNILKKCAFLNAVIILGLGVATTADAREIAGVSDQDLTGVVSAATITEQESGVTLQSGAEFKNNKIHAGTGTAGSGGALKALSGFTGSDVTFTGNSADSMGGGVYIRLDNKGTAAADTTVSLDKATFTSNTSGSLGGAIAAETVPGGLTISNSDFTSNNSANGGAIASWYDAEHNDAKSLITLNNNTFSSNSAGENGGAILNYDKNVSYNITGNTFSQNTAGAVGGAIANNGIMNIDNTSFTKNTAATLAGAIYNEGEIISKGNTFSENAAQTRYGGALVNSGKITLEDDTFAKNNSKTHAGAIYNDGELSSKGSIFTENTAKSGGGAIFGNSGKITLDGDTFTKNSAGTNGGAVFNKGELIAEGNTFSGNTAKSDAGAIYNQGTMISKGNTYTENKALVKYAGAIYNSKDLTVDGDTFTKNTAGQYGGAIYNSKKATVNNSTFTENTVSGNTSRGGAIYNANEMTITDSTFTNNTSKLFGGAVYSTKKLTINGGSFAGNTAVSGVNKQSVGGAIYNTGEIMIDGTVFRENHATDIAGAVFMKDKSKNATIKNALFESNTANHGGAGYSELGSGDLLISDTKFLKNSALNAGGFGLFNTTSLINVTFDGNTATGTSDEAEGGGALFLGAEAKTNIQNSTFANNTSGTNGGAITTRSVLLANNTAAKLDISNSKFSKNTAAKNGGAIYSTFYNSENGDGVSIQSTDFTENKAQKGGAIYNEGTPDKGGNSAKMTVENSTFAGNSAVFGGGIYNKGTLTINNNTFANNKATGNGYGGAIYNDQRLLTIEGSTFKNNNAAWDGGAISSASSYLKGKTLEETRAYWQSVNGFDAANKMVISNSTFDGNTVDTYSGGALGVYSDATITNTTFSNNNAGGNNPSTTVDGGGAIYAGGWGRLDIDGSTFTANSSNIGGAIATTHAGLSGDEYINIKNSTFTGNRATEKGGAIANGFSNFTIENSTFTDNAANGLGGAIHNQERSVLNLSGTNVFSGNTAGGKANDIHNLGTLNIAGDLTLDGGISGTGSVVFDSAAKLTAALNTTTIAANSVATNGANLSLIIANGTTDGTYDFVKADTLDQAFAINANTLYDIEMLTDGETKGSIVLSKKSSDEIVNTLTQSGLSESQANTAAAVTEAQPTNEQAKAIADTLSAAAQTGDTETVAKLSKGINPVEIPVIQHHSVSVATQIFNAAGNRMSLQGTGRSGGSMADFEYGPWVQGLYNKTHNTQGDGFNGYAKGYALGVDVDVSDATMLGLGYAYTATDIKMDGRKTQVYGDNIFVYGKYQPNAWYVSGVLNYGHSNYKETSLGLIGKYDVDTYSGTATVGRQSGVFDNYAGVRYTYINPDDYSNGLTTVHQKNAQVATAIIGTKISKEFKTDSVVFKPEFRLAGTYDFKSDNSNRFVGMVGGTSSYIVDGKRLKRAAVETGVGLTTTVWKNLDLTLSYDAQLRSKQTSQTGSFKMQYHF